MLSEEDKEKITKILKRQNRFLWNESIILKVIEILNQLRSGAISRDDWFVPEILSYEDYVYQIQLNQYL